jgi:hypothetical protein
MASANQCTAACSSSFEREIELLRQQLTLEDALLGEIREAKNAVITSKDAVIVAKDKLLAEFQEKLAQRLCDASGFANCSAGNADLAQRLVAAEMRLQQLEAANTSSRAMHMSKVFRVSCMLTMYTR